MAHDLQELLFALAFPLLGNPDDEARALRVAALLPGFSRKSDEGEWGQARMSLADAGAYRDVLFDLWEQVGARPSAMLRLNGESLSLQGFKNSLQVLDCATAHDAPGAPANYCRSTRGGWDWGCLHLSHVAPLPGIDGKLDRPALSAKLGDAAEERRLRLCPYFDPASVAARVEALPEPETRVDGDIHKQPGARNREHPERVATTSEQDIPMTRYADIGGLDAAIRELRETIELPLKHPEVFLRLGVPRHRGALLHGPPGCGKTLLAKAVANESGALFLPISGPELITKWHGESEEKLREVFAAAKKQAPSIVFFDEIDAIAQSRSSSESLRLDARFTTQLLTLLDGVHDLGRVFVLAATNRMDLLDKALLRPGRFDRIIEIPPPDREGRLSILRIHTRAMPMADDVALEARAAELEGFTGADIAFLVREAAYVCLRRTFDIEDTLRKMEALSERALQRLRISDQDFQLALDKLRGRDKTVKDAKD
jgi:AAA+ superfamily predicted ATPase